MPVPVRVTRYTSTTTCVLLPAAHEDEWHVTKSHSRLSTKLFNVVQEFYSRVTLLTRVWANERRAIDDDVS